MYKNLQTSFVAVAATAICYSMLGHSLPAQTFVYEPFADSNASLTGNATGAGLTGNWTATAGWDVLSPTMTWGNLATSGNYVRTDSGGSAAATLGSSLSSAGLLNDGATLWFSMIFTTTPDISTNPDAAFAFGTDSLSGSNNIPMSNSGQGIGFSIKQGQIRASTWSGGALGRASDANGSHPATAATKYFITGELIWGANDTINIYLPDTDLNLGSVVATRTAALNQALFDIFSYAQKNDSQPGYFDEIRFGARYVDVAPGATLYWDTNMSAAGTNTSSVGNWTDVSWSQDPNGLSATIHGWGDDDHAVFSAGTNGTGTQTITVVGTQKVKSLTVQEGSLVLVDGGSGKINLDAGAGTLTLANGSTLGGNVTVGGNVTGAGNIAPGLSPGEITIEGDFDISGTYLWELAALTDDAGGTAGVDWDLVNTGSADLTDLVLDIDFISGASDPDSGNPFWNSDHTWLVVDSAGSITGNFSAITYLGSPVDFEAGIFTTFVDGNQAFLQFTVSEVPEPASIALWMVLGLGLIGYGFRHASGKKQLAN